MKINAETQRLLIIAYSNGKEAGHHETVEGQFYGDGKSETHDSDSKEWLDEALTDGTLNRSVFL